MLQEHREQAQVQEGPGQQEHTLVGFTYMPIGNSKLSHNKIR